MNGHASAGAVPHRRSEIADLVSRGGVRSQEELAELLRRRGFEVAQPTLSRDLRKLGVLKTATGYVLPTAAAVPPPSEIERRREEALDRTLRDYVLSVRRAGSLVVLRTAPAEAQPLARALDETSLPEVIGTLAGDDTIFIATAGAGQAGKLSGRLLRPIHPKRAPRRPRR